MAGEVAGAVSRMEEWFFEQKDWEVKENANKNLSYSNFIDYFYSKFMKNPEVLSRIFSPEAARYHFSRDIHIHKLPHSLYIPYCNGWSLPKLLRVGLKTPTIYSNPAKHLDTAVSHLVNFFFLAAQEFTGAMAVSAVDLNLAPFIEKDKLDDHQIRQAIQRMLFELNYPSRMGYQSVFSNVTVILDTAKGYLENDVYVGGERVGKAEDYLDQAIRFTKILIEEYLKGDAVGQPFTFPIPTLMITERFDWEGRRWGEVTDLIFEALAKRGTFYILNGYASDVEALYSMCCRLTIDMSKLSSFSLEEEARESLKKTSHGIWAIPDSTGSIGVVTINLPRIAIESNGEDEKFFEILEERLRLARGILMRMRRRYEHSLRRGLMPITKVYLNTFHNHFNTFGLVGLPEAAANFLGMPYLWLEDGETNIKMAVSWMKKVVRFVREYSEIAEKEDGVLYNVEEIPAESTAYRFAIEDYRRYREKIERGEIWIPTEEGVPFYSNSIIPYYANMTIYKRALYEGEVQQEFTGGVMMHLFFYELPDPIALKRLIKKIVTNTKVVYFSITPSITVCKSCGWRSVGVYTKCPKCGGKTEVWSRIVGYYRPVSSWNIGKRAEFNKRIQYGEFNPKVFRI